MTYNIEEIQKLLDATTVGEWKVDCSNDGEGIGIQDEVYVIADMCTDGWHEGLQKSNAAFIAANKWIYEVGSC